MTYKVFKRDMRLPVGMSLFGIALGPMIVFEVFLFSWLRGFYDPENGPIRSFSEIYSLY